jgi:hypothetical protein
MLLLSVSLKRASIHRLCVTRRRKRVSEAGDYCKRVYLINQYTFPTHYDDFI